jgi:hypothetical protein
LARRLEGLLADRLGRRRLSIVTAIVFSLGAAGAALAPDTAWLIIARVVAGVAIGVASFVSPLYISEIAPVAIRGKLVSINQVALTSGIVISYLDRLRVCAIPKLALDVCAGGDSGGRLWHRTLLHSRQPAMACWTRTFGPSPRGAEKDSQPGTNGERSQRDSEQRIPAKGRLVRTVQ